MRVSALIALLALCVPAYAHEYYNTLRDPKGIRCCGEDDCEAIGSNYKLNVDGSVTIYSERWKASILVSAEKITWLPVPGGEDSEAHWCGNTRQRVSNAPIDDINPDPKYWTYCMFIMPGGA